MHLIKIGKRVCLNCSILLLVPNKHTLNTSPPSLLLTVCLFWVSLASFVCLFLLSVRVLLQIFPNGCCLQYQSVKMCLGKINEWGLFLVNLLIHRIILGRFDLEMAVLKYSFVKYYYLFFLLVFFAWLGSSILRDSKQTT